MKKNIIIVVVLVALIIIIGYLFKTSGSPQVAPLVTDNEVASSTQKEIPQVSDEKKIIIGQSVEGRDIEAYTYGQGQTRLLFVGGIHGGYEWNTTLVAYELMDYLDINPEIIPANLKITVIPVLNPDGLNKVVDTNGRFTSDEVSKSTDIIVSGRFNAKGVDLNRNFDCDWQKNGIWQKTTVSGGDKAFSEPESLAVKNYIETQNPAAVVVWYSAAGGVFASNCHSGVSAETQALTKIYAAASGYKAYDSFDFYETTGDMVNWLAKKNIPAISVILTNHNDTEWTKNRAGIEALIKHYTP